MSVIRVSTSFNLDIDFETPAFHRRLFAWMIDLFILVFYIFIMSRLLQKMEAGMNSSSDNSYNMWAVGLVLILPFFLYHPVSEILMNGQSIGKRILGIRVVNENGGKPGMSQYIIRWLIRTSDYMVLIIIIYSPYIAIYGMQFFWAVGGALLLLVADIILVNSKKQQRLGDLLAHTILINTHQKT
ncbi:MAG TPA: RDD family protein, partial [Chitinophagaceae bacterium]|nr:RDD family protein [Chitinophagaceae bacterium]